MKHANISIFVPHMGCTNDCSFCNQKHITGVNTQPTKEDIDSAVEVAIKSKNYSSDNFEIAFFGGSFTAIDREYMIYLLKAAYKYVKCGAVSGIRISTRPDAIDTEVLEILSRYGVSAIELGAQSMNDKVLAMNNRGHTASDVIKASKLIKDFGFELGLQMMTGLYSDTDDSAIDTAEKIIELAPDTVRIYPTIVLRNTELERLYCLGVYTPQTLDSAVSLCVCLVSMFNKANIKVIRLGLHSIEETAYVAGPWHPAFSELCDSLRFYNLITDSIDKNTLYDVEVNPSDISKAIGQKRSNLQKMADDGYLIRIIQNNDVERNTIKVREVKRA